MKTIEVRQSTAVAAAGTCGNTTHWAQDPQYVSVDGSSMLSCNKPECVQAAARAIAASVVRTNCKKYTVRLVRERMVRTLDTLWEEFVSR